MYTLARTQKTYGSFQSSFSNIAAQLGRVPLEILKLQAPHFSICFNSFFPPPFIYRQNALPVGVPVMKEHPVIVLSSSFSAKSIMLHFYTQQKYKNEKRATRQNRGDAYVTAFTCLIKISLELKQLSLQLIRICLQQIRFQVLMSELYGCNTLAAKS